MRLLWSVDLTDVPPCDAHFVCTQVVVGDKVVMITNGAQTVALDALTGAKRWAAGASARVPDMLDSHLAAITARGLVLLREGPQWTMRTLTSGQEISKVRSLHGRLPALSPEGILLEPVAPDGTQASDAKSRRPLWSSKVSIDHPTFDGRGHAAYVADDQTHFIELASGRSIWMRPQRGSCLFAPDGWVIVSDSVGRVVAVDAGGKEKWTLPGAQALRMGNGHLFALQDKKLAAVETRTGKVLWSAPLESETRLAATADDDAAPAVEDAGVVVLDNSSTDTLLGLAGTPNRTVWQLDAHWDYQPPMVFAVKAPDMWVFNYDALQQVRIATGEVVGNVTIPFSPSPPGARGTGMAGGGTGPAVAGDTVFFVTKEKNQIQAWKF